MWPFSTPVAKNFLMHRFKNMTHFSHNKEKMYLYSSMKYVIAPTSSVLVIYCGYILINFNRIAMKYCFKIKMLTCYKHWCNNIKNKFRVFTVSYSLIQSLIQFWQTIFKHNLFVGDIIENCNTWKKCDVCAYRRELVYKNMRISHA